jgi:hypothetical protein
VQDPANWGKFTIVGVYGGIDPVAPAIIHARISFDQGATVSEETIQFQFLGLGARNFARRDIQRSDLLS